MPDAPTFFLFLAAASLVAVTPGPGIFYVAARTLAGGRAEGLASSFGTGVGGLAHVLAGALGLSALVLASAEAFTALKVIGAIYLVWLGIKTWRQADEVTVGAVTATGAGNAFREGMLVEALNPKTAVFFLAFLPQFVDPTDRVAEQFIVLGLVSVALNTAADIVVACGASRVRDNLARRPTMIGRLRKISAAVMCSLGAGLMLARRSN